jgi:O-antigen/teichoic acid export membrane protein
LSRFSKDGLQTLGLSGLSRLLGIAIGVALARTLGPAGKGEIAYAAIALELFVVVIGGVTQAVTFQYARDKHAGGAIYRAMLRIVAAISLPAALIVGAVALAVPSQRALLWAAVAIPFAMYGEAAIGMLIGAQRIGAANVQRSLSTAAFNLAAIVALLAFHADAAVVLALWVLGYVAGAVYAAIAVRPLVREGRDGSPLVREQAQFAVKASSAGVAGYVNLRIDVVVVSFMLGPRALGNYTLAITSAELLWQLTAPFCWAAMGRIAVAPLDEAALFTSKVTRHIVALIVPLALVTFAFGPFLIVMVYGNAFESAASALRWIVPGVAAYAIEIPLGYFLMVKLGRPLLIVAIQTASIVVCAALAFATVRRWGIDGAAAATSITYVGVVVAKAIAFARATGVPLHDLVVVRRDDLARVFGSRRVTAFATRARTLLPSALR